MTRNAQRRRRRPGSTRRLERRDSPVAVGQRGGARSPRRGHRGERAMAASLARAERWRYCEMITAGVDYLKMLAVSASGGGPGAAEALAGVEAVLRRAAGRLRARVSMRRVRRGAMVPDDGVATQARRRRGRRRGCRHHRAQAGGDRCARAKIDFGSSLIHCRWASGCRTLTRRAHTGQQDLARSDRATARASVWRGLARQRAPWRPRPAAGSSTGAPSRRASRFPSNTACGGTTASIAGCWATACRDTHGARHIPGLYRRRHRSHGVSPRRRGIAI